MLVSYNRGMTKENWYLCTMTFSSAVWRKRVKIFAAKCKQRERMDLNDLQFQGVKIVCFFKDLIS